VCGGGDLAMSKRYAAAGCSSRHILYTE